MPQDRRSAGGPATGFTYRRRVHFAETDMAGIVHFSTFFRYMEEAEHALWRAAGVTLGPVEITGGWPRVAASFEYKNPLRFEDEFDVTVRIGKLTRRSVQYEFTLTRGGVLIGTGSITAVCGAKESGRLCAVELPDDVVTKLHVATGQSETRRV